MILIDNYGKKQSFRKISIPEFEKHNNHFLKNRLNFEIFRDFISKYNIDFALNSYFEFYGDHQTSFYSTKLNSIIITVQPYILDDKLYKNGFNKFEKNKSWYFPDNTYLYVKKVLL